MAGHRDPARRSQQSLPQRYRRLGQPAPVDRPVGAENFAPEALDEAVERFRAGPVRLPRESVEFDPLDTARAHLRGHVTRERVVGFVIVIVGIEDRTRVVDWAMRSFFGELLAAGVGLYLRDGPMLHAKLLVIDDLWACIGSANVDPRSFALNYELNVGVTGEPAVSGVSGLFDAERDASQRLSAVRWKEERSVIADAWSNLFALFGPLL